MSAPNVVATCACEFELERVGVFETEFDQPADVVGICLFEYSDDVCRRNTGGDVQFDPVGIDLHADAGTCLLTE